VNVSFCVHLPPYRSGGDGADPSLLQLEIVENEVTREYAIVSKSV
jgi:hypothetical protein